MRNFFYYHETEPGLIQRKTDREHYYYNNFILGKAIYEHYQRMLKHQEVHFLKDKKYNKCLSLGGGNPSFETNILNIEEITSVDYLYDVYKDFDNNWRKINNTEQKVEYVNGKDFDYSKENSKYDLLSFVHVLEHIEIPDVKKLFSTINEKSDLIIYGPWGDAYQKDNWCHARAIHEHIWFADDNYWIKLIEENCPNRKVKIILTYCDDILIYSEGVK